MGLEAFSYITSLNSSNPVGASDPKSQGDDHLRGIKLTLLQSFPAIAGAMTLTHTQLNNAAIKDEANVFTDDQEIQSAAPRLLFDDSDAAANERLWDIAGDSASSALLLRTRTDADGAGATFLTITRTTTTVDAVQVNATDINIVGNFNVLDAGETDSVSITHDGTDGNIVLTNSTDLNFSGVNNYKFSDTESVNFYIGGNGSGDTNSLKIGKGFDVASNIQFVRSGTSIVDFELEVTSAENVVFTANETLDISGGTDFRFIHGTTELFRISGTVADQFVATRQGMSFRAYDATNTDYIYIRDTGSQAQINSNTNPIYFYPQGAVADIAQINSAGLLVRNGKYLRIYDSGNTDYIQLYNNATNAFAAFSGLASWVISGLTGNLQLNDGIGLRIFDSSNTDRIDISHDGTDANITCTNTTEVNLDTPINSPNTSAAEWGYKGIPSRSISSSDGVDLTDAGSRIYLTGGSSQTLTIPANGSVAFPVGSVVEVINDSGNDWSIAITTDTLEEFVTGNTGTRTLADNGKAILEKVTSTLWKISGLNLS